MRSLFDVNLLLALLQPDHVHFDRAQEWWKANQQYGWASCPLTQNGFARIHRYQRVDVTDKQRRFGVIGFGHGYLYRRVAKEIE